MGRYIAIVSDRPLIAHGMRALLAEAGARCLVVGRWDATDVVTRLRVLDMHAALIDVNGSDDTATAASVIAAISRQRIPVIVMASCEDQANHSRFIRSGARGVVHERMQVGQLLAALGPATEPDAHGRVQAWSRGRAPSWGADGDAGHAARERLVRLTATELAVLTALSDGVCAIDIARSRSISINTVRSHVRSILSKLEVNTQLAAVAVLHQREL